MEYFSGTILHVKAGIMIRHTSHCFCRAINVHVVLSVKVPIGAAAAAPRQPAGHASTGNDCKMVAGISSFAFQVGPFYRPKTDTTMVRY